MALKKENWDTKKNLENPINTFPSRLVFGTPAVKSKLKRVYLMLLSLVRGSKGIVNKRQGRFLVKVKT